MPESQPTDAASQIKAFGLQFLGYWYWWLSTIVSSGAAGVYQNVGGGRLIPNWALWLVAVSGIIVSAFLVWRDQFVKSERLSEQVRQLTDFELLPRLIPIDEWDHVFVFENEGPDIYDFKFKLTGDCGRGLSTGPISCSEILFETILKGQRREIGIIIGQNDPREYLAEWSWKSIDSREHKKKGTIQAGRLPPDFVQF